MTDYSRSRRYGGSYDGYVEGSTMNRMEQQYWQTKQTVFRKLGKKEDECIIASDAELDSKLELFLAIKGSCATLMRVLEIYQDKMCTLCQEENALGRFLKDCGKQDKTRAGKMMTATGKTLSFTAQKGIELRAPLVRLYQEVETFQIRAIADTFITVEKMEKSRNAYRGSLMWMKDVSQQLDPGMNRQLEKFRKVQGHVRRSKSKFDKLKVDTLQKVDLLSASRCNMFSHALVAYQNTLLQFWEKTSRTMSSVAESFKGYQHYEFNMLKELTESSKKLAEETSSSPQLALDEEEDKDKLIFFDAEYHDEDEDESSGRKRGKSDSLQNLYDSPGRHSTSPANVHSNDKINADLLESLLDLEDGLNHLDKVANSEALTVNKPAKKTDSKWQTDLLTNNPEVDDVEKDNMTLLNEILEMTSPSGPSGLQHDSFAHQWNAAFGKPEANSAETQASSQNIPDNATNGSTTPLSNSGASGYLPSQLLSSAMASLKLNTPSQGKGAVSQTLSPQPTGTAASKSSPVPMKSVPNKKKTQNDMSAWFNLFADLDPLSNPDAVGRNAGDKDEDRSC